MTNIPTHSDADSAFLATREIVSHWVNLYLKAWETNASTDIAALFTEDAEYHESPYETEWIGLNEIIEGWQGRWDWQTGGWRFEWSLVSLEGNTAVITGIGHYAKLGNFDNLWTVALEESRRATRFVMVNTERA